MQDRAGWKRGRFGINTETTLIHRALRSWQNRTGDVLTYFRFQRDESDMHEVYDEATGAGRVYYGRWQVPALHVTHVESPNTDPRDSGLYVTDTLRAVLEYDQLAKFGLTEMDIKHGSFQRDRIAYDNVLYAVQRVSVLGQIRRRDVVVVIEGEQIQNDEIVNDPMFTDYLTDPTELPAVSPQQMAQTVIHPEEGASDDPYS
ncbi:hypothetical protein DMB38_20275 [Streptomyces sp. WAC 06738]|uniref:hypothetical protein n=1 Tax=Streptomyces sp. WAC 06738 TaxID=2203210 RepID=UPI000F6B5FFC|nr:hypothetical protein [Streptomyces sp. WAC 06738]AZM47813.1 hypothetical protein DMB38_20275 [Streptomyces sp. WAC 06738]